MSSTAVFLALLISSCGNASAPAEEPAAPIVPARPASAAPAEVAASAPATPDPAPAPAPAQPAVAMPAAGGLATLAEALNAGGVTMITRVEGVHYLATRRELPPVDVTWVRDGSGNWACLERPSGPPQCLTLPDDAKPGNPSAFSNGEIHLTWTDASRASFQVLVGASGNVTATRRAAGAPRDAATPLPAPVPRATPPLLAALRGVELDTFTHELFAIEGARLAVCRIRDGVTCGAPIEIPALARPNANIDGTACVADPVCVIDIKVRSRVDNVSEDNAGQIFVRVDPDTLAAVLVATAITDVFRETRGEGDSSVEIEIENGDVDMPTHDCLRVGRSRASRLDIAADGGERRGSHRLRRAPAEVPATGVDPFTTTLEGTWTVLPTGGLRRRPGSCPEP